MSLEERPQNGGSYSTTTKTTLVARKLARVVLSLAESQNTIISRSRLQKMAKEIAEKEECGMVRFPSVLAEVNMILDDVYGFELRALPARVINPAGNSQDASLTRALRYILLSKNEPIAQLDDFIIAQSEYTYVQAIQDGQYIGDQMGLPATNTLDNRLGLDQDQVMKGLTAVILCIVLFSKNNIIQQELLEHLQKFGVPTDGSPIPVINMPVLDLLRTLDRLEYLSSHQEHSDLELETVTYRIGRRTQAEFPLDSLILLIRNVMGITEQQSPKLREDIKKNIADAYPTHNNGP